jgi:hypothetical protein
MSDLRDEIQAAYWPHAPNCGCEDCARASERERES